MAAPTIAVDIVAVPVGTNLATMERALIMATLRHCAGNLELTAATLGISLKTLYNRRVAYGKDAFDAARGER